MTKYISKLFTLTGWFQLHKQIIHSMDLCSRYAASCGGGSTDERVEGGGSLGREKQGAEGLTSEEGYFCAFNYQQLLREWADMFISAASSGASIATPPLHTHTPQLTASVKCTLSPFVTSSFNDAPVEKKMQEFSSAPTSRISHEYFSDMWGVCHGSQPVELTGSALYPPSSPSKATPPHPTPCAAINHVGDRRTLDTRCLEWAGILL